MTDRSENPNMAILTELPSTMHEFAAQLDRVAAESQGSPEPMLGWLRSEPEGPWPRVGQRTLMLWELFARTAAVDLVAARTLEPHVDARSIIDQAANGGHGPEDIPLGGVWGVFAAEAKAARLEAAAPSMPTAASTEYRLSGTKPWCSLAGMLDYALVSAHVPAGRQLFAIDLRHSGVSVEQVDWASRGLANVPSGPIRLTDVPAIAVGEVGWYLDRPGFAWGGAGVAACWFGGAYGLFLDLLSAATKREPDQIALAFLGRAARKIRTGCAVLREAAQRIDAGRFSWADAVALRGSIAGICDELLGISAQTLGPAALAFDEDHAQRAADLAMYVQQHHGLRDDESLGASVLAEAAWSPTSAVTEG